MYVYTELMLVLAVLKITICHTVIGFNCTEISITI